MQSGLHTDARACPSELLASVPEECRQCYRDNWSQIRSRQWGGGLLQVHTCSDWRRALFRAQTHAFKVNLSFGFILNNVETGEMHYYHPSQNGLKNLERKTQELASTYWATLENPESFASMHLRDLQALEQLFAIHTFVYALTEDGKVELVYRPTDIKPSSNHRDLSRPALSRSQREAAVARPALASRVGG